MLNKVLAAVFVVLFVVVVGELIYLFVYKPDTSTPAPLKVEQKSPDRSRLGYWQDIIVSSTGTNIYEGVVVGLITSPGQRANVAYEEGIKIKYPANSDSNFREFLIRKQDLPITKVYNAAAGVKIPIKFTDLKQGDKIRITEVLNLADSVTNNRIEVRIDKL